MTPRHARRSRIGLLLIALGVAVGVIAYLIGRADEDEAGPPTPPQALVSPHGTSPANDQGRQPNTIVAGFEDGPAGVTLRTFVDDAEVDAAIYASKVPRWSGAAGFRVDDRDAQRSTISWSAGPPEYLSGP